MGLAGASPEALASSKTALDEFLADPQRLAAVRRVLAESSGVTPEQRHVLDLFEKTFKVRPTEWGPGGWWGSSPSIPTYPRDLTTPPTPCTCTCAADLHH